MRVQILSSQVGGGHQSVARALAEALERSDGAPCQVWIDDLYAELARFPASRFPWMYGVATRRFPWLWRLFFRATNRPPGLARFERLGDVLGGPKLARMLASRRPDLVVSVLPGVNGFVARVLARLGLRSRLAVAITDWADIHLSWIAPGVHHYLAPTEAAAQTCRMLGVDREAVSVHGFPVRRQFVERRSPDQIRRSVRERLGLPEGRFVALAMIGGEGSPAAVAHMQALARCDLDAALVIACGRSRRLRSRIAALNGPNDIRALGFVDAIAELMVAADLLVTKPGGATLAEAFACGLPVIAFDPLPGQEEGNLRYVVPRGAAALARSPRQLAEVVSELRWSPAQRTRLAARGAALARPAAAEDAVAAMRRCASATLGSGSDSSPRGM